MAEDVGTTSGPNVDEEQRIRRIRVKVRGLRKHITIYVLVNALLFLIDVFTAGGPWFLWPLLAWGIGLAAHWISVMQPDFADRVGKDWEDRMVERLARRRDDREDRK